MDKETKSALMRIALGMKKARQAEEAKRKAAQGAEPAAVQAEQKPASPKT